MKKSTVVRLVIMALSVVLTVTCVAANRGFAHSAVATVTGTVTRVDEHPAVDYDDHDSWDVYAEYEYQGTVFSDVHISSQAGYKVGDSVQIQVNAKGKDLDGDIDGSQVFSLIGMGLFAFTAFTFLLGPRKRIAGTTAKQGVLNCAVVRRDLTETLARWNGTELCAFSYLISGLYFAMFAGFLANTLLYGGDSFLTMDCLWLSVVLFVLPTMKRISLQKHIEKGHFQISTSNCINKVEDTDYSFDFLYFDNKEKVYLSRKSIEQIRVGTPFYFVSVKGRKHPPLWYVKDCFTLDDDLRPFLADTVQ